MVIYMNMIFICFPTFAQFGGGTSIYQKSVLTMLFLSLFETFLVFITFPMMIMLS